MMETRPPLLALTQVRTELRRHGWAAVLAIGVVGVDKCLQALAVACLEVALETGDKLKAVVSVRKWPVAVTLEEGKRAKSGRSGDLGEGSGPSKSSAAPSAVDGIGDQKPGRSSATGGIDRSKGIVAGARMGAAAAAGGKSGKGAAAAGPVERLQSKEGPRTGFVFEIWLCDRDAYGQV